MDGKDDADTPWQRHTGEQPTMHGRSLCCTAAAVLFGLAFIHSASAQEPARNGPPLGYGLVAPAVIPPDPESPPQSRRRFGCWASHLGDGCGSFRSHMVFVFGSCRAFYGEGCQKAPPPPYPPTPGQPGYEGYPQKSCNCW
jgi:hypothetical protein